MAQIFLSYSRTDADSAKAIATALMESGHSVWWDKHISGGSKFAAEIERALGAAEVVIVLWSKISVSSPWVLDEAAEGRDTDRLLPIALDDCKPPLGFRQFQTIAAQPNVDGAVNEVLGAIAARLAGGASLAGHEPGRVASHEASQLAAARRLGEEGRFEAAWRELDAALRIDSDAAEGNSLAGWMLYVQGRTAEATVYLERAAAASKGDYHSPAMLISCYRATSDDSAMKRSAAIALARAEHAAASALSKGAAFASGAKALAALDHGERARKWLRKALALEPGSLPMRYDLAATLACYLGDVEAAMDVLEPFIEAASKTSDLLLLEMDPDWKAVRDTRAFQALVNRARQRVRSLVAT